MHEIVPFDKGHDRTGFDCGEEALNKYLQETARQHIDKVISKTFVCVDTDSPEKILGYFTLAICEVVTEGVPRKYAKRFYEGYGFIALQSNPLTLFLPLATLVEATNS